MDEKIDMLMAGKDKAIEQFSIQNTAKNVLGLHNQVAKQNGF